MTYSTGDSHGSNRSAQFDADPAAYGELLDDLFVNPEKYRSITLNRRYSQNKGDTESLTCSATLVPT